MEFLELESKVKDYCKKLTEHLHEGAPWLSEVYGYTVGQKYIKVFDGYEEGGGNIRPRSVFCFIDFDGNIYKPAGWNKPARGIRAHIDGAPLDGSALYRRGW